MVRPPLPVVALAGDEAVSQRRRQQRPDDLRFDVVRGVVLQDVLHAVWMVHQEMVKPEKPPLGDFLREIGGIEAADQAIAHGQCVRDDRPPPRRHRREHEHGPLARRGVVLFDHCVTLVRRPGEIVPPHQGFSVILAADTRRYARTATPVWVVGPPGRWDKGAMSEPATLDRRYRTRGGITIHRSDREVALGPAAQALVERLDRYPGVFMSSCFEFPGRYTRWDLGFAAPPLAITCRGRDFEVTALEPRGRVLLEPIRAAIEPLAAVASLEADGDRLQGASPAADGDRAGGAAQPAALDLQPVACGYRPLRQRRGPALRPLRRLRLRPRPPVRAGRAAPAARRRPARSGALRAGRDSGGRSHVGARRAPPLRFRHPDRRYARHGPRA